MEPTKVDIATLPTSVFMGPYVRMAKAHMPMMVIRQRMSIDIQVPDTHRVLDPIVDYLQGISNGQELPEPGLTEFQQLMSTVHIRLEERGKFVKSTPSFLAVANAKQTQAYTDFRLRREAKRQSGELDEDKGGKGAELGGYIGIYASEGIWD